MAKPFYECSICRKTAPVPSREKRIPPLPTTWISWVLPLVRMSEMEIATTVGLDAYMMLRVLRMGIIYFTIVSVYGE